jgi:L-ascorbate metabolism protein UlaG (beta-lactamase superfamily)
MEIEYKGANGLLIKTGQASLAVDPKLSLVGLKDLKVDGAIEVLTAPLYKVDSSEEPKILIEGPGEYEASNISIRGVAARLHYDSDRMAVCYRLDIAGFRIAVLGHISVPLSEDQLEELGVVDIITVPVGGNGYTLDAHEAAAIVRQIDPKIVIPTHYNDPAIKYEVPQDGLEGFLKELGATQHDTTDKLKLKTGMALPAILTVIEIKRT